MSGEPSKPCPFCAEPIQAAAIKCPHCKTFLSGPSEGDAASQACPADVKEQLRGELRRLNLLSFALGLPGLALQFAAIPIYTSLAGRPTSPEAASASMVAVTSMRLLGVALLIGGLCFNARYKGRGGAWGLLGLLSCVGLLILYFMGKICHFCKAPISYRAQECRHCGAPA